MRQVRVSTADRDYDIRIGPAVLQQTGAFLQEKKVRPLSKHLLITDDHVKAAGHLDKVLASLAESGYRADVFVIPPGEESKSLDLAGRIFEFAYRAGLDRRSVVLALGGGVVGDLAGFIAATYMRGIDFVQLPTTLLAHDSAVGGKVAVNLPQAKNIIGAFHQPLGVLYDTKALRTLPIREMRSGLAEAIKHGVIRDADLFAWIVEHTEAILVGADEALAELLARSCRIKADVVSADERETGLRAILNFGHTIGHAVEGLSAYGRYSHGEAVAIGMAAAADLSVLLGLCSQETAAAVEHALEQAGLPTRIPNDLQLDEMIQSMRQDKKATGGDLTFILLKRLGEVEIVHDVPEASVRAVIERRRKQEDEYRARDSRGNDSRCE